MDAMDTATRELPSFARQLKLLKYPHRESFDVFSTSAIKALVLWLEDSVFQFLMEEEKGELRAQEGDEWRANGFHLYLEIMGSPFAFPRGLKDDAHMASVVEWLLNYAMGLRFQRNAADYNAAARAAAQQRRAALLVGSGAPAAAVWVSPSFVAAVGQLAQQLGLAQSATPADAHDLLLACARQAVRQLQRARPVAAAGDAVVTAAADDGRTFALQSGSFPLGFDTGNDALNDAGRVLRLLYAEDLRQLQTRINELLVLVQNVTADPQVDSALGQVGR